MVHILEVESVEHQDGGELKRPDDLRNEAGSIEKATVRVESCQLQIDSSTSCFNLKGPSNRVISVNNGGRKPSDRS